MNDGNLFRDLTQKEWAVRIDFNALDRIRTGAQFDLGDLKHLGEAWAALVLDDRKALDVVWFAVQPTAAANSVDRAKFNELMNGETLEAALGALGAALVSFTQPQKRGLAEKAIQGVTEGAKKVFALAASQVEKLLTERTEAALEQLGNSQLNAPEFSDISTAAGR